MSPMLRYHSKKLIHLLGIKDFGMMSYLFPSHGIVLAIKMINNYQLRKNYNYFIFCSKSTS